MDKDIHEKVFTVNRSGEVVEVTRRSSLIMLLINPYSVWTLGKTGEPDIWRGTGKRLFEADVLRQKYPGSKIFHNGVKIDPPKTGKTK